jgi:integrase/recombinase XerD
VGLTLHLVPTIESNIMTWGPTLNEFATYQLAKGLANRTIQNRYETLQLLAKTTGKQPTDITRHDLLVRLARDITPSSKQRERSYFRSFFQFMLTEGYRADDPSSGLPTIRAKRGRPRPLTTQQVNAMLIGGAYTHTRTMILLAAYQGLRAHEIAKLQGQDFDLSSGILTVVGKGSVRAELPLHPVIAEETMRYPTRGYWFPGRGTNTTGHIHSKSVSDLMRRALNRAGITSARLTGHSLRHFFGTELVRGGTDLRTAQELLRHASLATTQIYVEIAQEQQEAAIINLPVLHVPEHSGRKAA